MKTIRLYQNAPFTEGKTAELDSDNSHHLNKVLRFPVGQNITLFNGDGFDYTAVVQSAKKTTNLKVISKKVNNNESKLNLTLAQGIAKGEKMDFLIQKAVELGVTRIIPMKLERCVVRLRDEKVQKKIDHWQKIANHACEQSGRSVIVDVSHPA
ncbi:MAG: 16S rRNA (uracil(1498)-N(3))-methyltransferase, partial [Thiotrichales bacterium]|nr:16S rRNA (uracil(1498)-N(3))-methyltransferase [Thiotrichales bacterium]